MEIDILLSALLKYKEIPDDLRNRDVIETDNFCQLPEILLNGLKPTKLIQGNRRSNAVLFWMKKKQLQEAQRETTIKKETKTILITKTKK